jgi:hypothetical protein
MRTFNTAQAARFTGIPAEILVRMRTDSTRGNDTRGPPFCRIIKDDKRMTYQYKERELIKWLKTKLCKITANDAAYILQISRTQVLALFGLQRMKVGNGEIVINSAKNFFLYLPKKKLKLIKGGKR